MGYRYYEPSEVIALRSKKLNVLELGKIDSFLKTQNFEKEGYVNDLYDMTLSQLIIKAGFDVNTFPSGVETSEKMRLELLAERLTRHFLKRKLNRVKQPEHLEFKSNSEILDPHHHLNSVYVKDNLHLLNLLPDFVEIYSLLRKGTGAVLDPKREEELRSQEGVLTDAQFLGRAPKNLYDLKDNKKKFNPTVGYVRGDQANPLFKEGFIKHYADKHHGVCRSCDMCGLETKDTWKDLERYINHTIRHKAEIIRFHIGETNIPSHGKNNVEQLFHLLDLKRTQGDLTNQTIRLGHGTHMGIESMKECSQHGYYVEACLASNKETGIIANRKEYPLGLMLLLDVKVMLGTDGGDIYYTDIRTEYAHAKKVINHFLDKVNKETDEIIQLPNRDRLQYKLVKELFKDIQQAQGWDDGKALTYKDLKLIEHGCKEKINIHKLVDNMNEFKEKMFPVQSKNEILENQAKAPTFVASEKIDLSGCKLFTDNRKTRGQIPCFEISCSSEKQADLIAAKLQENHMKVYETTKSRGFWRVKIDNTPEVAREVMNLISSLDVRQTRETHSYSSDSKEKGKESANVNKSSIQDPLGILISQAENYLEIYTPRKTYVNEFKMLIDALENLKKDSKFSTSDEKLGRAKALIENALEKQQDSYIQTWYKKVSGRTANSFWTRLDDDKEDFRYPHYLRKLQVECNNLIVKNSSPKL